MEYCLENGFSVFNLTQQSKLILKFLICSTDEADFFVFNFLISSSNENMAVENYRLHKIIQRNLSLNEFLSAYNLNCREALEELFLSPIREHEFSLLTNIIKDGKITIVKLFEKHKLEPWAKLLRLLVA